MWFSLFATVLILAITFYEGLQGLFSGLINCILTVVAVALAFGLYEDLYFGMLKEYQPDHGRAIALMSIFIVSLLVLRTAVDMIIKGNQQFPVYVDRAGGGVFGFINGMLVVGMLSIGFEMLPFGDTVLGFGRFALVDKDSNQPVPKEELANKDPSQLKYVRNDSWLRQGSFTAGLASHLSGNALAGRTRLGDAYPDFLASAWRARARMGEKGRLTPEDSFTLDVEGYWDLKPTGDFFTRARKDKDAPKRVTLIPAPSDSLPAGHKRIAIRVKGSGTLEFTPEQVRLVVHDANTGKTTEHLLAGINDELAGNRLVEVYDGEILSRSLMDKITQMDLVFEVPESAEFGEGTFLEYKQNTRVEVTAAKARDAKSRPGLIGTSGSRQPNRAQDPGSDTGSAAGGTSARPGNTSGRDRVSGLGPARGGAVTADFPMTLTEYSGGEVSNGEFKGGRLIATFNNNWEPEPGDKPPLERFQVPSDMRLMQVNIEKLQPGSYLGRALDFAASTLNDFRLVAADGKEYPVVGMYAFARVGGKPILEATYLDETARQGDAVFGRVAPFERIKRGNLQGDYALFYVFQVPVGTKADHIRTGRQPVDLKSLNLEAK